MEMASGRLEGKIAVVTGGGAGIGGGVSRIFGREGAAVVVADNDPAVGLRAVAEIQATGGRALFVETDVAREEDIKSMITQAHSAFGGIDVLINNAGFGVGKTVEESNSADWERIMTVNARSIFLSMKYIIPHMRTRRGGSIVNIGSLFALRANPSFALYHATKGAVRQLTKTTALAHAGENIRVNAVHPGLIETPASTKDLVAQGIAEANLGPMGRWGEPSDIAYACLFLASDEARFITGIDLAVDGGLSA